MAFKRRAQRLSSVITFPASRFGCIRLAQLTPGRRLCQSRNTRAHSRSARRPLSHSTCCVTARLLCSLVPHPAPQRRPDSTWALWSHGLAHSLGFAVGLIFHDYLCRWLFAEGDAVFTVESHREEGSRWAVRIGAQGAGVAPAFSFLSWPGPGSRLVRARLPRIRQSLRHQARNNTRHGT